LRPFVERLITLAKKNTLHARRLALSRLPDRDAIDKLFKVYGPRFEDRPGGYTRIVKRLERRLGDAGRTAYLELLKSGEEKVLRRKAAPAPVAKLPDREEESPAASDEASESTE